MNKYNMALVYVEIATINRAMMWMTVSKIVTKKSDFKMMSIVTTYHWADLNNPGFGIYGILKNMFLCLICH